LVFTFAQQNRDEGMRLNSSVDGVKWKDLMSTLILDRLETSFDNWDDELPHKTRMTQNTKTYCDGRTQCTTAEGESSRMEYFADSACYDDNTGHMHTTTDHDSIVLNIYIYV